MIQCTECEYCHRGPEGELMFTCDPFSRIKEPECLAKWQLLKLNTVIHFQERLQEIYDRMAPMQEKLFSFMEREISEQEEAESWKQGFEDEEGEEHEEEEEEGEGEEI